MPNDIDDVLELLGEGTASYKVADAEIDVEDVITEWARGNLSNNDARKKIHGMGWTLDSSGFRGKYGPIKVFSPDGREHEFWG